MKFVPSVDHRHISRFLPLQALFVKMCNRSASRPPNRRAALDQWSDEQEDVAMAPIVAGVVKSPQTPPALLHAGIYPPSLMSYSVDGGAAVVPCCYNVTLEGAAAAGAALPVVAAARVSAGLIPSTSCSQHKNIICTLYLRTQVAMQLC